MRNGLANHGAPFGFRHVGADAKSGQFRVAKLLHALGVNATQNIDDVTCSETLFDAVHGGQQFLYMLRAVHRFRRMQAGVAVAAWLAALVKIMQQLHAATGDGFAQANHGIELGILHPFEVITCFGLGNHAPLLHHVL